MKFKNNILKMTLLSIILILLLTILLFKSNLLGGNIIVESSDFSKIETSSLTLKSTESPVDFNSMPVKQIYNINISVFNEPLNTSIYEKSQRYYISLSSICNKLNSPIYYNNDEILINNIVTLYTKTNSFEINNKAYKLRGDLIFSDAEYYMSLSDIETIFNLRTHFNFENKSINFINSPNIVKEISPATKGRLALIRLEDFAAGGALNDSTNIEKFKLMGDLLYSKNIGFHIAWVPRYVEPDNNIDNDLLNIHSLQNVAFINLLDHLINRGGLVGLHGYTHQYGNETSLSGTELSKNANKTTDETRVIIENAINTAHALNIPFAFFESPHYKATKPQKKIIEEYFKYIYEPYGPIQYFNIHHTKTGNIYIPTPLSYVRDLNISNISRGINSPKAGSLVSLFYHPIKELDFIDVSVTDTNLNYTYSKESPLSKIIKELNSNGYITSYITEIN